MPDGFFIGSFKIYFYGIIITSGILLAAWLASYEARRRGEDGDRVWDILVWLMIGGVIGARIWHIFSPPQSMVEQGITTTFYLTHPLDLINIRNGGLGIPGAVIGGLVALYWYSRKYSMDFPLWTDIVSPSLALGQAIGRWGNFFNQELYGAPTDLPWAIFIDPGRRLPGYQEYEYFHPLFLYESIWSFANMGFLLWLGRRFPDRLKKGDLFLLYLVIYPVGRFLLEFIRLDASQIAGLNANQTVMLVVAVCSIIALILRHRLPQVNIPANPE
ncbi:MAG: prolipoprotein diacylglyceryl transferase [Anaerolineales bacterium]|nr:prolipoprotein diacylglyceryl transferase [Anaerolineales bacterium]